MSTRIMTKEEFIQYAQETWSIAIPIKTGKEDYEYISLDKDSFFKSLRESEHIKIIQFEQVRDEPDSAIWICTPESS